MNEHDEYLRTRREPVTFREFMRDANWWLVGAIVFLLGFWVWVGYNVVEWVP